MSRYLSDILPNNVVLLLYLVTRSTYATNHAVLALGYIPLEMFVEKRQFFYQNEQYINNIIYHQIANLLLFWMV